MKENLLKIINHYGVMPQLKYFQSEVFELNESIFEKEKIGAYPGVEEREHISSHQLLRKGFRSIGKEYL